MESDKRKAYLKYNNYILELMRKLKRMTVLMRMRKTKLKKIISKKKTYMYLLLN